MWLTDIDDAHPTTRIERSDQIETVGDVMLKNAEPYPKIARRGYAGEEFFLKASKSVPRIGRRNNDIKESPKRSINKVRFQTEEAEIRSIAVNRLKNDSKVDTSRRGCNPNE